MTSKLISINCSINGQKHRLKVDKHWSLLELLRNHLHLTGAKKGCDTGVCGACTVIVNQKAVRSCNFPVIQADNAEILTIEGMRSPDSKSLHPLQWAFLETGAVQCGFCTPGMIMAAWALLLNNPSPTDSDIKKALQNNLCRCTGYQPVLKAVKLASDILNQQHSFLNQPTRGIGSNVHRVDGIAKVTGHALFTNDIQSHNFLHGAVALSPVPSGVLNSIDSSKTLALNGVYTVITAQDIPGINGLGRWKPDRPVIIQNRIRYTGDILALVLADDEKTARQGVELLDISITPQIGIFSTDDAIEKSDQPIQPDGNIVTNISIQKQTSPDTKLADRAKIIKSCFTSQCVEHAILEPESALAYFDDNCLTVVAPSQNVFFDRMELMRVLGLKPREFNKIRIIEKYTGGAFGKHEDLSVQPLAALGTFITGRPVKITLNRTESFSVTTKRHPMTVTHESVLDPGNQISTQTIDIVADTGPYASWAPNILRKSAVHATGAYCIPNVSINGKSVHTNNAFSGAFRGFGAVQTQFAAERHVDIIAHQLHEDPLTFRCRHALKNGHITATGQTIQFITPVADLLNKAAEKINWNHQYISPVQLKNESKVTGFGIAAGFYGIGYGNGIPDKGQVHMVYNTDNSVTVYTSAIDYGQGAHTIFTQIISEILDINVHQINFVSADTKTTPDSGSTVASRQTMVTGNAMADCAKKIKQQLSNSDAPIKTPVTARSRFLLNSEKLTQSGQGNVYRSYATCAAAAKLQVCLRSGKITLKHIVAVHDSGTIIHPIMAESQVTGGVMMAAGMTLLEHYILNSGVPSTNNLSTYSIPRFQDTPTIDVIFLPTSDPAGPFGAKGLGEPAMIAAGPAILNAVCNAVNFEFNTIPVTPQDILKAISSQQ